MRTDSKPKDQPGQDIPTASATAQRAPRTAHSRRLGWPSRIANTLSIAVIVLIALMLVSSLATQRGYSLFGIRTYIVITGSMSPAFDAGSYIVVAEKPAKDIEVGDVISYATANGEAVLTHRVVEKNDTGSETSFITRGDANNTNDERPVEAARVLGTVVFSVNGVGSFLLSLRTPTGLLSCLGILAVVFFAPEVYRLITRPKYHTPDGDIDAATGGRRRRIHG